MSVADHYAVKGKGEIQPGFVQSVVIDNFSNLFRLSPHQAAEYITTPKIINSNLSEQAAQRYAGKLTELGLSVCVVDEAANNSIEAIDTGESQTATSQAPDLFFCPKCHEKQPKGEECIRCGIIFSKFRKPGSSAQDQSISEPVETDITTPGKPARKHRMTRLVLLSLATLVTFAALFGYPTYKTRTKHLPAPAVVSEYAPTIDYSTDVSQLMKSAGLSKDWNGLATGIEDLFANGFRRHAGERGVDSNTIDYLSTAVPKAFNAQAAEISIGNWIDQKFSQQQITQLLTLFGHQAIKRSNAIDADKSTYAGMKAYEDFKLNLQKHPMATRRRNAIENLVDTMRLDKLMAAIWLSGQQAVSEIAGMSLPDASSSKQLNLTQSYIEDHEETLRWIKPAIREEAIFSIAWHHRSYAISEIQTLTNALDKPLLRQFFSQLSLGVDNFLSEGAYWLIEQNSLRPGRN